MMCQHFPAYLCPQSPPQKTELLNESLRSYRLHQLVLNTELSDASDNAFIRPDFFVCVCVRLAPYGLHALPLSLSLSIFV